MTEVTGITSSYYSGWADSKTAPTAEEQTLGKDAFLKLLVAQLKYQDPTNPTDSAQFMQQTAQFTLVEKMEQLLTTSQSQSAIALVGKSVTWNNALGKEQSGVVTGVSVSEGKAVLDVGTEQVALDAVIKVKASAGT
jgi:flagellar basal-body rod modification protein FlgD